MDKDPYFYLSIPQRLTRWQRFVNWILRRPAPEPKKYVFYADQEANNFPW